MEILTFLNSKAWYDLVSHCLNKYEESNIKYGRCAAKARLVVRMSGRCPTRDRLIVRSYGLVVNWSNWLCMSDQWLMSDKRPTDHKGLRTTLELVVHS